MMDLKKLGLFVGGALFGSAGIKVLSSDDAKKLYTQTTAAVLRAKECVMTAATTLKENTDDILADAREINELPPRKWSLMTLPRKPRLNLPKPAQRWRIWHEMQDFA